MQPLDWLIDQRCLSQDALDRAARIAAESDEAVAFILTRLGLVSERDLTAAFLAILRLKLADLRVLSTTETLSNLSPSFLRQFHLLPLERGPSGVVVAMANPLDDYAAAAVSLVTACPVVRRVATQTDIDAALDRLFPPVPAADRTDGAADGGHHRTA